jgi:hypothetical protein
MLKDKINPRKKSFVGCTELATNIRFIKAVQPGLRAQSDNNVLRILVTSALKDNSGITHYFLRLHKYCSKIKDHLAPGISDKLTLITNSVRRQFLVV